MIQIKSVWFRFLLCSVFTFLTVAAKSQNSIILQGHVVDASSKPIEHASISLLNSTISTSSNAEGNFQIQIKFPGEYILQIKALNFAIQTQKINLNQSVQNLKISLTDEKRQLNEVVVTAQKRAENEQKSPLSITAISAKNIDAFRLQNSKDLTAIVPNLYSANPGDNRNVTSIRGISTTSYDPAVSTYIDGVSQFSLDTYITQLLDVERIEVLRGPQGTLYGRNAMGGVINIITKEPTNQTSGFGGIEFGNYGEQRYTFGLRTPLIKDKLFFGISGLYSHLDGYYENLFNNQKFDRQNTFEGNYFLKYLARKSWQITLNAKHNENRNNGAFPLALSVEDAFANPYKLNQNAVSRMIDDVFNTSLSVNYSGNQFNFSSQTAYQSNRRYYQQPIDGDFSPADAVSIVNNYGGYWNKVQVLTQEFRFTSPANIKSKLKWTSGIYGFYQDNPSKQGTYFGNDAALAGSPISNFTSINTNYGKNFGVALYGQGTYSLTDQFAFTAGLRYDYEHRRQSIQGEFQANGQAAIVTRADTAATIAFHAFSPKIGLNYNLNEAQMLYATYSRGFRTGGISQLSSDPSQPPLVAYQPEYSNNYEIGSKNTFFNNRLRVNLAAFYTLVNHAQVPTLVLPDAITITKNVGKLHSKGVEIELAAKPFTGLEISNSTGLTHARYTELVLPLNGEAVNSDQNRPVFSPNATSMTAVQYNRLISTNQKLQLILRGEWQFIGDQFFDLANTIEQKPYQLFNGTVGIALKKLSISFWERNISGKKYIDYAYDFGAAHLGNPRTYGISLKQQF
ncbi:MAG: TonB-dependent receptor [Janthinobacterium lividum]